VVAAEPVGLVQVVPAEGGGENIRMEAPLYVATPAMLAHLGIAPSRINAATDVITSRSDLGDTQLEYGPRLDLQHPVIQRLPLPRGSSEPNALITEGAMARLGLQPTTSGWLLQTPHSLTTQQIATARKAAAAAGLAIETRNSTSSLRQLAHEATVAGILLALGVLALTIGLIRSETADDLRVLTAAGATRSTRRLLSAATSGALALLAGILGTGMAYLALAAFYRSDLSKLDSPPTIDLVLLVVGLPLAAFAAGWLLAGREPAAISRRPLD
jgi:putative ABC transport system permease protein